MRKEEEVKDGYTEGERVLPPVSLQSRLSGLCYRPSKDPPADKKGLHTVDHTDLYPDGSWFGSCLKPRQDVSNLICVGGLTGGDINYWPGYLRIKSPLGKPVNPEFGPFSVTECSAVTRGDTIIIILLNYMGGNVYQNFLAHGLEGR